MVKIRYYSSINEIIQISKLNYIEFFFTLCLKIQDRSDGQFVAHQASFRKDPTFEVYLKDALNFM